MSSSFRKIDYSLRPAKYAERRMLAEVFRRLVSFAPLHDYVYVGLGSVWFSDFILFHRALGIREMISFERSSGSRARFQSNMPFRIDIRFIDAGRGLAELGWTKRKFIWLDYDSTINTDVLSDVRTVAARCQSGTALAVSVQCNAASELNSDETDGLSPVTRFTSTFGAKRVGGQLSEKDLYGWDFGELSRSMVLREIEDVLTSRNSQEEVIAFHPICEIEYSDDAKMTTVVGVFVSPEEASELNKCSFDKLDFLRDDGRAVRIELPKLTMREIRHIEQQLPQNGSIDYGAIPASEADKLISIYRYFPNFSVVES